MSTIANSSDFDRRQLITPEGVNLEIRLASLGSRIAAYAIDQIIINGTLVALFFIVVLGGIATAASIATSIFILLSFFLRNFYFMFFEMGTKAATPGKRICKVRVASRGKARLTADAVFARNALREIEFNLPLSFLFVQGEAVDAWIAVLGLIWSGIFLFFPLFNKDRLRAGDLIGGTWVVRAPKAELITDLAAHSAKTGAPYLFSQEQIDAYGVYELHTLENVIRVNDPETVEDVAQRIRNKIRWSEGASGSDLDFLQAYYAALRERLETRLLFGVRRKDKFDDQ
ncbi:MAG: RDD family protein [Pseudomonadota bacterium]